MSTQDSRDPWLPVVLSENHWGFITEHLQELPSLEFPVSLGILNNFIDKFIMLKGSPSFVPSFLTSMDLNQDQQCRVSQFTEYKEELQKQVSERDVFLVNESRIECTWLTRGVYFTRREAIKYLEKKGLLDRAFAAGCSWRDQIREPGVGELSTSTEIPRYYGLPQELIMMGIQKYRETLTLRKSEVVASQLVLLYQKLAGKVQVIEENSYEINSPVPVTEPVSGRDESRPNLVVDAQVIQVSAPSAVGNDIKSCSPEHSVIPEKDEVQFLKKNTFAESEIISVYERDPAVKKFIGMKEVIERLGVSRPTIYNYLNLTSKSYNPNFPKPLKLNSENKWVESEFNAFMETFKSRPPLKKNKIGD